MTKLIRHIDSQWATFAPTSPLLEALTRLSARAQKAINLRFWENRTIEEIAGVLRISWDQADYLINQSLGELRGHLTRLSESHKFLEAS